jgi:hypothetical protein
MRKVMGLAKPQSTIQQMATFFNEQEEDIKVQAESESDQVRKIKCCAVCKVQKCNHIVKAFANTSGGGNNSTNISANGGLEKNPANDSLRQQVLNLAPREVIEQVIFDPQHGIVKREIHFGIIDYLTVSCLSHFHSTIDLPHEEAP